MATLPRKIAKSREQERRGAALHGGRVQPGSGSGVKRKGDVVSTELGIEYKRTDGKAIRLTLADIEQNRRRALSVGRVPILGFELGGRDYVISEAADFQDRTACRCAERVRLPDEPRGST